MIFEVGGKRMADRPTEAYLRNTLRRMESDDNSFAVLSLDENDYIQTAGDSQNGYVLEWCDGEARKHYYCAEDHLTIEDVIHVFTLYLQRNENWKSDVIWDPLDLRNNSQRYSTTFMLAGGVFLLTILWLLI